MATIMIWFRPTFNNDNVWYDSTQIRKGEICLQKDEECVEMLKSQNKDKIMDFQLHNKTSVTVWLWDMEDDCWPDQESTVIHKYLP